jgi:hypothetical protein
MANGRDDVERALNDARRAREDAERLREDAKRAREEARRAREDARRIREEARRASRGRPGSGSRGPGGRHGPHPFVDDGPSEASGVRVEQAFSMDGVRNINIDHTAGKLVLRLCAGEETPGVVSTGSKAAPELEVKRDGDRLHIDMKLSKGWLFRRRQGATTVVRLAESALESLRIDNGYGETEVNGITATEIRVGVGAGSVQCIQTRGTLDVNVGAGKIAVLAHSGLARADSGTGDVVLDIAELAPGDYKVDVGLGRAEVRLPAGGQVHIRSASGIGKNRVEYPSAGEDAPTRLKLNSGIGEVVVKMRDGRNDPVEGVRPAGQPRPQRGSRQAAGRRLESEELRVLQMLEQGKITPQDAADLIAALRGSTTPAFDDEAADEPL